MLHIVRYRFRDLRHFLKTRIIVVQRLLLLLDVLSGVVQLVHVVARLLSARRVPLIRTYASPANPTPTEESTARERGGEAHLRLRTPHHRRMVLQVNAPTLPYVQNGGIHHPLILQHVVDARSLLGVRLDHRLR